MCGILILRPAFAVPSQQHVGRLEAHMSRTLQVVSSILVATVAVGTAQTSGRIENGFIVREGVISGSPSFGRKCLRGQPMLSKIVTCLHDG